MGASSFLTSRVANAILVLVQLALVGHLYGTVEASKFFVLWTVIWAGSVGVRFGFDQLLPKRAAAANLSGSLEALAGYRQVATFSIPIVTALSVPILILVLPDVSTAEALLAVPVVLVGAIGWAVVYLTSALARGYGHPGLSGWLGGPVAIGLATLAVPLAHLAGKSWLLLGVVSSLALLFSSLASLVLIDRAVGARRTRTALLGRSTERFDPDTWSTGALMAIAEVNLVLPVWIAGALGLGSTEVGALYAALRVAAAFSWIFTSVVVVITPMLAEALAGREYERLRRLLWRSAVIGAGATLPIAAAGALLAGQLLGLLDSSYRDYGYLLMVLIGARLLDAATGAVAEALILGDHARWELINQVFSSAALLLTALLLEPGIGVLALALASAVSVIAANLARVVEVRWLISNRWQTIARAPAAR